MRRTAAAQSDPAGTQIAGPITTTPIAADPLGILSKECTMNIRQTLAVAALSLMAGAAFAAPQASPAPAAGASATPAAAAPAKHKAKPHHHRHHAAACKAGETMVAGKCEAKKS